MSWIWTTAWWYIMLLILGLVFVPITKTIFGRFFDFGYSFSKIVGLLILSYSVFLLGLFHLLPFYRESLFILVLFFALINFFVYRKKKLHITTPQLILILFEEFLFIVALFFWVYVRGQEPSIRGLEKFMDFGFMNSILRSSYFPPADMWLSGHSINYYYFGHLIGAVLTKLSGITSFKTYNLILATIFAFGTTQIFSFCFAIIHFAFKNMRLAIIGAVLGLFLVNLGGNLHTYYAFTKGYPNEKPQAPWTLTNPPFGCFVNDANGKQSWTPFCPQSYWYPNATRFIPFTIHEFPLYSYVVADLHGHVFDIPIVLLTLAVLFIMFTENNPVLGQALTKTQSVSWRKKLKVQNFKLKLKTNLKRLELITTILLGFLTAVNYMTNAFDGPIYMLLTVIFLLMLYRLSITFVIHLFTLVGAFFIFSLPFSLNFKPFVTGIGVNCAPGYFVNLQKLGPFIFEKGNCQVSSWWMLVILWGFFWFNFTFLALLTLRKKQPKTAVAELLTTNFFLILFAYGMFLIIIPEFFYIKDIYPAHFRANTMFKLGYQAFSMMGIACVYTFIFYKKNFVRNFNHYLYFGLFAPLFLLVAIYPFFAVNSYYGKLDKPPQLDGTLWLATTFAEYTEIVDFLNSRVAGQPIILEAQGDSYTDFNVVSSYTGLPTVAGWLVHQWLWRGSPNVVSDIAPDIQQIYETEEPNQAIVLLKKHNVDYVIVGSNERNKYKNLKEEKFNIIGKKVLRSQRGSGAIYKIN